MVTMREAKRAAFAQFGIPEDGGDSEAWVDFKLGPVPLPFPNTDARRRAVKLHDLHHVLTGYRMDIIGEFEISAWEIAAGCGAFGAAWVLNLMGTTAGLLTAPSRTMRAFWRGAHSRSLYTTLSYDEVIDLPVDQVRKQLGVPAIGERLSPRFKEALQFGAASCAGLVLALLLLGILLTPVTLIAWVSLYASFRRDKARRAATSTNAV